MSDRKFDLPNAEGVTLDVITSTPQTSKIKKTKSIYKKSCINATLRSIKEFTVHDGKELEYDTSTLNYQYRSPYKFFDVIEILNVFELQCPYNGNLKTVGIYTTDVEIHFLWDYRYQFFKSKNLRIALDLNQIKILPSFGEAIEVYGFVLNLDCLFVVQYWTRIDMKTIQRTLSNFRNQKCYVISA